ncbi:MAG: PRC-barrel domain-containing protein [Halioglobus sp.]|nr:PRC-barrel domain-containing protein [Halioglobus sp.]
MSDVISLTDLIHRKVYAPTGDEEGAIENLLVDPDSGIVRFASIKITGDISILMPWAAMIFSKSKSGFVLTHRGESIMRSRVLN